MKKYFSSLVFVVLLAAEVFYASCNNKEPYTPDFKYIGGYVIGKETCNADEGQDYWLVDFTLFPSNPHVGDTLTLNGITYTNVLKLKGLADDLKHVGMKINIYYKIISADKIITTGCSVTNPETYALREIFIISQAEIR